MNKYWRRVYVWGGSAWYVKYDALVEAWSAFQCEFGEFSWCKAPEPYVFEQWWRLVQGTWGSSGEWVYEGHQTNY